MTKSPGITNSRFQMPRLRSCSSSPGLGLGCAECLPLPSPSEVHGRNGRSVRLQSKLTAIGFPVPLLRSLPFHIRARASHSRERVWMLFLLPSCCWIIDTIHNLLRRSFCFPYNDV